MAWDVLSRDVLSYILISIWLLVGFHPAIRSVQSTPVDNTRKRVRQYIEKERRRDQVEVQLSPRGGPMAYSLRNPYNL